MTKYDRNLSAKDAAPELGYTPKHLSLLARRGKIPATLRIRKWFFSVEEVRDFFARQTAEKQMTF